MDRRKVIYFALWVAILINVIALCLALTVHGKEIEIKGELKDGSFIEMRNGDPTYVQRPPTVHDLNLRPSLNYTPMKPVRVPTQTVAQCYCWVDNSGNMTWGQLKNVPMECFQGFDKIKGWSRGLIQKPVVGR